MPTAYKVTNDLYPKDGAENASGAGEGRE